MVAVLSLLILLWWLRVFRVYCIWLCCFGSMIAVDLFVIVGGS